MDRWRSQLHQENHLTPEKLQQRLAELKFEERNEYGSYEYTIYKDGVCVYVDDHNQWDGMERCQHDYNSNEYFEFEQKDESERILASIEIDEIVNKANFQVGELIEKERLKNEEKVKEKARIQEEQERQKRLSEYEKLKKEFDQLGQ